MIQKIKQFIILVVLLFCAGCIRWKPNEPDLSTTVEIKATNPSVLSTQDQNLPTPAAIIETPQIINTLVPQAFNWKNWPILPAVSESAKEIYRRGLALGNDPTHFSVLGDCQSEPGIFMGRFESDPAAIANLPQNLQETVNYFKGSFSRSSPTVKPGTTAGAILWADWIDQTIITYCNKGETPLECELRVWKPSIVLINLGTHWEDRNGQYITEILDMLISKGVLPILATKADNREGDNSINLQIAETAEKYDIPIWNFWKAVQELPNGGLKNESDVVDLYLTDEGLQVHRYSALEAIDSVWWQVKSP